MPLKLEQLTSNVKMLCSAEPLILSLACSRTFAVACGGEPTTKPYVVCCSVLQCVAVCRNVLQCVAACCSAVNLQQGRRLSVREEVRHTLLPHRHTLLLRGFDSEILHCNTWGAGVEL